MNPLPQAAGFYFYELFLDKLRRRKPPGSRPGKEREDEHESEPAL